MTHAEAFLIETSEIARSLPWVEVESMATVLAKLRAERGRLFIVGLGGSAANAVHCAADLRKLCEIDAYAMDNLAELTARMNDDGADTIFVEWMRVSNAGVSDALLVLSVGGGKGGVSGAIVRAVNHAISSGMKVLGIVGPDGGYTSARGHLVIRIGARNITPQSEAFQSVIWHCLVSHPLLQRNKTKW